MGGSGSKLNKLTCKDIGYTGECFDNEEEIVNLLDKYLRLSSVGDKYEPKLKEIQDDLELALYPYFTTGDIVNNINLYRPRVKMLYKMVRLIIEKIKKDKIPLEFLHLDEKKTFLQGVLKNLDTRFEDVARWLFEDFPLKLQPNLKF